MTQKEFVDFVGELREADLKLLNGSLLKCRDDIFRDYKFQGSEDYPFGNGHFYLMPNFESCEELEVLNVNNAHIGSSFALQSAFGGPFFDLLFGIDQTNVFHGSFSLKPRFHLRNGEIVKPSSRLRYMYSELKKRYGARG